MKRKTILIVMFSILLFNVIYANGTKKEKPTYWEDAKISILTRLDSLIQNGISISFEEQGPDAQMQIIRGDVREIEYYYKWMCYGTKLTQKWGIDNISKWWYKPEGGLDPLEVERLKSKGQYVVTDADSSYIKYYKPLVIKKLYEFLDDNYPLLQVAAAQSLIRMHITDPLIIDKLKYYANRKNTKLWSQKINLDLYELYSKEKTNEKAISILIRRAENGLKKLNKNQDQYNLNKKTIKNLNRDLDWDGDISASYCIEWWGGEDPYNPIYNPDYTSYGADCANFASQCLIAGLL